jgi:hypothetical protein
VPVRDGGEPTTEELLATVRGALDYWEDISPAMDAAHRQEAREVLDTLAARLEAAEQERDEWRAQFRDGDITLSHTEAANFHRIRAEAAAREVKRLRKALKDKPNQPIQNACRQLLRATDNAERNYALGSLVDALAEEK